METEAVIHIRSLNEFYTTLGEQTPKHPLIGVLDMVKFKVKDLESFVNTKVSSDLYCIILKDGNCGLNYGRKNCDNKGGVLQFIGPNQVVSSSNHTESTYGFMLFFHPDLLKKSELKSTIYHYNFFGYGTNEALHLSKEEENRLVGIANNIIAELNGEIDALSDQLFVNNIQLLLNYSLRYYERQFNSRKSVSSDVVAKVKDLIRAYYRDGIQLEEGTPSAEYFAEKVNLSTNYLSDLLRKETGKTTKELVDDYLIQLAKSELISSSKNINEIAYNLGFNYPHYFSRMFKKKTGETPQNYRLKEML